MVQYKSEKTQIQLFAFSWDITRGHNHHQKFGISIFKCFCSKTRDTGRTSRLNQHQPPRNLV